MDPNRTTEAARIGKTLVIKGELSGNEDLYIDGRIEGKSCRRTAWSWVQTVKYRLE
jgi:hypothetical protein